MSREQRESTGTVGAEEPTPFVIDDTTMPHLAVLQEFTEGDGVEGHVAYLDTHRMASTVVELRAQLAAAEVLADYKQMYLDLWDSAQKHYVEREELRAQLAAAELRTEELTVAVAGWKSAAEQLRTRAERAEAALRVAAGIVSTLPGWSDKHPQEAHDWIVAQSQTKAFLDGQGA